MTALLDLLGSFDTLTVIGGGGKTGLIEAALAELFEAGRPALATMTTHLARWQLPLLARVEAENLAEALTAAGRAARGERLLLAGPIGPNSLSSDKFEGLPLDWLAAVRERFAGLTILVEADGSRGLPLKAHRPGEPVLPARPGLVVGLVGAAALTEPFPQSAHRPELVAAALTEPPRTDAPLSPGQAAEFLGRAWARLPLDLVFINQADSPERLRLGRELAERLAAARPPFRLVLGSLRSRTFMEIPR